MTELSGITWDHPRGLAPLAAAEERYAAAHGVRVRWRVRSLKDFGDAPLSTLAERFDLIVLDHPHMGVAAASGCLTPLDDLLPAETLAALRENHVGPCLPSYDYAGHLWALPVDAACQVASFRPDLLPRSAIPRDWQAVLALAAALRPSGRHIGVALCPTDTLCTFLTLCAQLGDGPRESRAALVDREVGRAALDHMRRLRDAAHPDSLRWNPIALYDHMTTHDDVVYCPLAFGYTNYARPGVARPLRFAGIPGRTHALLGGAGLAVSARRPHAREAAAYAAWICGPEAQRTHYVLDGGQPAHPAAWTDPAADAAAGGFFSDTRDTLLHAYTRPRHAGWPAFQEYLGERVHAFLAHEHPRDAVLDDLEAAHRAHLPSSLPAS